MERDADWRWSLAAAAVSTLVGIVLGGAAFLDPYQIVASGFLAGAMGAIAFVDARSLRVPDIINLPAALGALVFGALEARWWGADIFPALASALLAMIICGVVFFILREAFFRLRGFEGLGFGDVKLAATGGAWLGWQDFPLAVLFGAVGAIVFVAIAAMLSRGAWSRERKIPFAAFFAPAIWLVWIFLRIGPV
jgi:leader peptidase (prepilin peptidase)/N-methyltransferase